MIVFSILLHCYLNGYSFVYIYVSLMHTCLSKMFFVFLYSNNVRCIFNIEISCGRTIEILLLCVKYRLLINLNIKTKVNKNY